MFTFSSCSVSRLRPFQLITNVTYLGGVSSPLCVNELRLACSLTQLCQYKYIY